jgi:fructooligosaccharide transport system permease protein
MYEKGFTWALLPKALLHMLLQTFKLIFMAFYFIVPIVLVLLRLLDVIYALLAVDFNESLKALGIFILYLAVFMALIFVFFTIKQKLRELEIKNKKFGAFKMRQQVSYARNLGHKGTTYLFLGLGSLIFLFPMIWMFASSTKSDVEIYRQMGEFAGFLPNFTDLSQLTYNYKSIIVDYSLWKYATNSLIYALVIVTGNIFVNSLAGYVLAKFKFPGQNAIMVMIILLLIIPIETTIIPLYTIVHNLGLTGTVFAIIIPPLVSIYNIFLFRQFFKNIPVELEEAAIIDGASKARIYFSIILPLSKPIIATIATFVFIGTWNDYVWPIMVLPAPSGDAWPLYPIQAALNTIQQNPTITSAQVMASLTLTTIPMIIFYSFMQKYIVEGLGTTGVKF